MRNLILYELDLEIERTFRLRKKKQRIEEQRREARKNSNIARSAMDANNFELKPALISMIQQSQFGRTPSE